MGSLNSVFDPILVSMGCFVGVGFFISTILSKHPISMCSISSSSCTNNTLFGFYHSRLFINLTCTKNLIAYQ